MQFLVRTLAILFVLFIAGCATNVPLQRNQLAAIGRETPPSELDKVLAGSSVHSQFEISVEGKDYFVRNYDLQTGTRSEVMVMCTPTCIAVPVDVPVTAAYAVIQTLPEKNLFAWGTLEELSKDPNPDVSSIMPAVKEQIAARSKK